MPDQITITLDITPDNAERVRQVLGALMPSPAPATATASVASPLPTSEPEPLPELTPAPEPVECRSTFVALAPVEAPEAITLEDFKAAAKTAKAEQGDDYANAVLDHYQVPPAKGLGWRLKHVDPTNYAAIIALWESGELVAVDENSSPEEVDIETDEEVNALEEELGDDLEEELGDEQIAPDAVKTALRAHAKTHGRDAAKAIMSAHGAETLSAVDNCTPQQLTAMFAKLT